MQSKSKNRKLKILIAYGPTREPLDPVRYLSNYSTGTMGRYLVESAKKAGHKVTAVESPPDAQTARDLLKKLKSLLPKHDALIMNSAVCDVRPKYYSADKIKKDTIKKLEFVKNPDILAELSRLKKPNQLFVGFALESRNLYKNAVRKLKNKKLELIVLQKVTNKIKPFGSTNIESSFIYKTGEIKRFPSQPKKGLAAQIIRALKSL